MNEHNMGSHETCVVIDIGSTSVSVSLWESASVAPIAELAVEPTSLSTASPESIKDAVEHALDKACVTLTADFNHIVVSKLGISCFGMSLVALAQASNAVAAFGTYLGDLNEYQSCSRADTRLLGEPRFYDSEKDRLGCPAPLHPSFAISQLRRLDPLKISRLTTLSSYLLENWTGLLGLPVTYSEASWWGMLNWRKLSFDEYAISMSGFSPDQFPRLIDILDESYRLSPHYAKKWSKLSQTNIKLAIVDGACAAIGMGPIGSLGCTIGTSAAIRVAFPRQSVSHVPSGCFTFVVSRDLVVVGGALSDGGSAVAKIARLLKLDLVECDRSLSEMPLPNSMTCLPFFSRSGERAPGWAGNDVQGTLIGITEASTEYDFVLAVFCSVGARLSLISSLLKALVDAKCARQVYISGTALAKSRTWQRVLSGSLDAKLVQANPLTMRDQEKDLTTSRGAAMLLFGSTVDETNSSFQFLSDWPVQDDARNFFPRLLQKQQQLYLSIRSLASL